MNSIARFIPGSKDKAKHLGTLVKELGASETKVKGLIKDARREGVPIMSGKSGYWLASSNEEQAAFIERLSEQAYSRLKTARELSSKSLLKGGKADKGII